MSATAKIIRVESPLPLIRHDAVEASAIATMIMAGTIQPSPRARPMATAIGTCSQSTASKALLVVSRKIARSSVSMSIPNPSNLEAGGNRLRIDGKPGAGAAQPGQPVMVVRPHHQDGRYGRRPYDCGIGGSGGQQHLLGAPPWRKSHGDNLGTWTGLKRQRCNCDPAHDQ